MSGWGGSSSGKISTLRERDELVADMIHKLMQNKPLSRDISWCEALLVSTTLVGFRIIFLSKSSSTPVETRERYW